MKIGILTGGGDVPPLNSVIFSARHKAVQNNVELIGFKNGLDGVLNRDIISLNNIKDYSKIGGTYLKSSRINLLSSEEGVENANYVLSNLGLDGLIIIGGDDTLSNAYFISEVPCILISKTIDNDIGFVPDNECFNPENIINYFTLGYPTAVEKIITYTRPDTGIRTTAYSHERIMILESMGMHSGWLALAAGMGNPDFIIIPEYPLDYYVFCNKLLSLFKKQRHAIIIIAEGAKIMGKGYIKADYQEGDDFDHPRFGGVSYALRDMLKQDLKVHFNTRNINAVNPSYIYRSGVPNKLDNEVSKKLGETAISKILNHEVNEHIFLSTQYNRGGYKIETVPISKFAKTKDDRFPKRGVPPSFYDQKKYQITPIAKQYFSKIIDVDEQHNNEKIYKEYYGLH
ncbi:MAG: 6-phosphofructokinase [Candidatus Cloacimonetes bacterium]|nr:6-phosphofructokinase [Candidatus Cloacimonadota bacterium]